MLALSSVQEVRTNACTHACICMHAQCCMHTYIHICVGTHIHTYIVRTYMHAYSIHTWILNQTDSHTHVINAYRMIHTRSYIQLRAHAHGQAGRQADRAHACMHACMHADRQTYIHACIGMTCMHTNTVTQACMHACTHVCML